MDAVAGLLDGPRARGAFLLRSTMDPPWSLRIQDEAPLTLIAIVRGTAWVGAQRLGAGDVAIARGPDHYTVADHPATPPQAIIHPGGECRTPAGVAVKMMDFVGVRTWGNSTDGETVMLTGSYQLEGEVSGRLLRALPPLLVLRDEDWGTPIVARDGSRGPQGRDSKRNEPAGRGFVGLLADEIVKDEPGQEAVLDRLLDLLLIAVLRAWFARPDAEAPGWYRAHGDPIVGPALRALHHDPAHPWTVAELADRSGVSRAALARRFNDLVGEPPMSFLTGWRIALAADLLKEPGETVGSVADRVGYGSAFALSTAFKRLRGISPRQYRLTAT